MGLFCVGIEFEDTAVTSTSVFAMRNRIEREISEHGIGTVVGAGMPLGGSVCDIDVETDLIQDELSTRLKQLFAELRIAVTIWVDEIEPDEGDG